MDHPNTDPEFTNFPLLPYCFLIVSKYSLKTQGRCLNLQRTTFRAHNPLSGSMKPSKNLANTVFMNFEKELQT